MEAAAIEIGRRLTEGQQVPPTNLDKILPRVDIHSCYSDPDLMISGELRRAVDGFEIAYSEQDSESRRRFTIAHEIAHAVFERTGPHCPRRGLELERLCDMIASQILVPHSALATAARLPITLAEIRRLAKRFETSLTMMAMRCSEQFPVVCAQAECGELIWHLGGRRVGLRRPGAKLKALLPLTKERMSGRTECSIELDSDGTAKAVLEWVETGQDRLLLILSKRRG